MTFWDRSSILPPILVRLLARHSHGPALTAVEISKASGLPPHQVEYLSHHTDWSGVDLPTMRSFLLGCGADFENPDQMKRIDQYLRIKPRPTWKYLRTSPLWLSYFQPLLKRYLKAVNGG